MLYQIWQKKILPGGQSYWDTINDVDPTKKRSLIIDVVFFLYIVVSLFYTLKNNHYNIKYDKWYKNNNILGLNITLGVVSANGNWKWLQKLDFTKLTIS